MNSKRMRLLKLLILVAIGLDGVLVLVVDAAAAPRSSGNRFEATTISVKNSKNGISGVRGKLLNPMDQMYMIWVQSGMLEAPNTPSPEEALPRSRSLPRRNANIRSLLKSPQLGAEIIMFKREKCLNLGDDACVNGEIPGSGKDDEHLNGSNNPGK